MFPTIAQVLAACPDHEWCLLLALARYGGLRTPSEPLALEWADVNWERNRFRVVAPKTEHQDGGERWVPLFPELRPHLEEAFDRAAPGSVERYGIDALAAAAAGLLGHGAGTDELVDGLLDVAHEANGGELSDDVAILCVSRTVTASAGDGHE